MELDHGEQNSGWKPHGLAKRTLTQDQLEWLRDQEPEVYKECMRQFGVRLPEPEFGSETLPDATPMDPPKSVYSHGLTAGARAHSREPVHLPNELILEILSYVPESPESQTTLYNICLVSRQWYSVAVSRLYYRPYIYGQNFEFFVRTICPSINVHVKRSDLAGFVHVLDLHRLVHHSTKSITARLLGRTKGSLEDFVAPQASFAINCFAALSKCIKLRALDLSLVSEAISYDSMAHVLQSLLALRKLTFPRCASEIDPHFSAEHMRWPPKLESLTLSGGVNDRFIYGLSRSTDNLAPTLTDLTIAHCPKLSAHFLRPLLAQLGWRLSSLSLHNLPRVNPAAFDPVLVNCPTLRTLRVSADYISSAFADAPDTYSTRERSGHPLFELLISSNGSPHQSEPPLSPLDLEVAIEKGWLGRLRRLYVSKDLGWSSGDLAEEFNDLCLAIYDRDASDFEKRVGPYEGVAADWESFFPGVPKGLSPVRIGFLDVI